MCGCYRWGCRSANTFADSSVLSETEIENLRSAALRHENIRGFNVAVEDAFLVCRVQSIRKLRAQIQYSFDRERSSLNHLLERLSFQKLHDDEGLSVIFSNFVDRTDGRMVQCGCSSRFTPKAFQSLRVLCHVLRKELDRKSVV